MSVLITVYIKGDNKMNKEEQNKIVSDYKVAFPKDFYLFSELGWWLKYIQDNYIRKEDD